MQLQCRKYRRKGEMKVKYKLQPCLCINTRSTQALPSPLCHVHDRLPRCTRFPPTLTLLTRTAECTHRSHAEKRECSVLDARDSDDIFCARTHKSVCAAVPRCSADTHARRRHSTAAASFESAAVLRAFVNKSQSLSALR